MLELQILAYRRFDQIRQNRYYVDKNPTPTMERNPSFGNGIPVVSRDRDGSSLLLSSL